MKTSELLAQARDELFKGWAKGTLSDGQNVCAVGALRRAAMSNIHLGSSKVWEEARKALDSKATEMAADVGLSSVFSMRVEEFNDHKNTTKDDVLALFDKVIIGLEEVGK